MNRTLPTWASSEIVPLQDESRWSNRREFILPEKDFSATCHSSFAPMHYEAGYAYPLIVWLHGHQSNEDELPEVMPLVSTRNFVGIAPRGSSALKNVPGAYTWDNSPAGIAEAADRVEDCIALAQGRWNINTDRVFIAGHGLGGTMAYRLGLEYPERFAGAISLGGRVPRGAGVLKHINRVRGLPLLLSVSPTESGYSTNHALSDLRFLHSAGMTLSLRLYPEGDELTTEMFKDVNCWVMEQFCVSSAATSS